MTAHTKPPAPPPPLPDESATFEREKAFEEMSRRMEMAAGYVRIYQANRDVWDTVGALQAVDKFLQFARDVSALRKKI